MMVEVRIELDAKFLIYRPDYTERQYHKVMKLCKNVHIHNVKRLHIFIIGSLI